MGSGTSIPNIGSSAIGDPIGKAIVEIIADDKAYQEGLKKSEKSLERFDKTTQQIAKRAGKAFLVGGTAITSALAGVIFHAAKAGDELDKMSLRTGVSVENLSRLSFAAERSGSDINALETSLRFLSRRMDEANQGVGVAKEVFEDLGIALTDQEGRLRSQPAIISEIADAISGLESETKQVAVAMDIFGARSGPGLLPLLKQGSAGIEELTARADELGIVISTDAAAASAEFQDQLLDMTKSLKMAGFEIGQTLLPAAQSIIEKITDLTARFNKLTANQKKLIGWATAIGGGLSVIAGGALLIVGHLPALIAGFGILAAFPAALPITIGVVALGGAIAIATKGIVDFNKELDRMARNAVTRTALGEQTEAVDLLRKAIMDGTESADDFRIGNRDLATGLARLDAIDKVVGDNIVVLDSRFAEITKTLGDTDGFISVTDAATKALEALAKITGTADVSKFKKLGEGVKGFDKVREALDSATDTLLLFPQRVAKLRPDPVDFSDLEVKVPDFFPDAETQFIDQQNLMTGLTDTKAKEIDKEIQLERDRVAAEEEIEAGNAASLDRRIKEREKKDRAAARKKLADDKKAAAEEQKILDAAELAQEQAAAEVLRAWEQTRDAITGAFEGLFDSMFSDTKPAWERFWDQLKNIAIQKIGEIVLSNTIGKVLDRIVRLDRPGGLGGLLDGGGAPGSITQQGGRPGQLQPGQQGPPLPPLGADPITAGLAALPFISKSLDILTGERIAPTTALTGTDLETAEAIANLKSADPKLLKELEERRKGFPNFDAALQKGISDLRFAFPDESALQSQFLFQTRANQLAAVIAADFDNFLATNPPGTPYSAPDKWGIFGLAKGAIVKRPTLAMIGESGPEAVIPLRRPASGGGGGIGGFGDEYVNIENLVIQMPDNIGRMSKAELDRETSRQIASTARAFRRDPRARRSFLR